MEIFNILKIPRIPKILKIIRRCSGVEPDVDDPELELVELLLLRDGSSSFLFSSTFLLVVLIYSYNE